MTRAELDKFFRFSNVTSDIRDTFWRWLSAKYDNNVPDNIDFKLEWQLFISDATSRE